MFDSKSIWERDTGTLVDAQPVMTAEELIERVRHAAPPTSDDVTILWDGRRLGSRESVMQWLAKVDAKRAEEAAAAAHYAGWSAFTFEMQEQAPTRRTEGHRQRRSPFLWRRPDRVRTRQVHHHREA